MINYTLSVPYTQNTSVNMLPSLNYHAHSTLSSLIFYHVSEFTLNTTKLPCYYFFNLTLLYIPEYTRVFSIHIMPLYHPVTHFSIIKLTLIPTMIPYCHFSTHSTILLSQLLTLLSPSVTQFISTFEYMLW